jgi:hypothetical protein
VRAALCLLASCLLIFPILEKEGRRLFVTAVLAFTWSGVLNAPLFG